MLLAAAGALPVPKCVTGDLGARQGFVNQRPGAQQGFLTRWPG